MHRNLLRRSCRALNHQQKKNFDLHEYQCKDLMRDFGIRVQKGVIALNGEEARKAADVLNPKGGLILKSQVHAGGRGKGRLTSGLQGGVKICKTPQEIEDYTNQMIGYNLITHQTTKDGLTVNAVLVHEGIDIKQEIYLAFIQDRNSQGPCIIASRFGGMEIEEVDSKDIIVQPIDVSVGLQDETAKEVVAQLGLSHIEADAVEQMKNLYRMFIEIDAGQVEINPWALDPTNTLYCLDAKVNIDDNAKFRQDKLVEIRKNSVCSEQVDVHEEQAIEAGLNYVALDGNIGCMVNGAGLAMATMDVVKMNGGDPANFLDVGGGANVDQIATAFQILSGHEKVNTILINIFGGILKCDMLADGIIQAALRVNLQLPLVIRLAGTNSAEAKIKMEDFSRKNPDIKIIVADDLDDAAMKAVQASEGKI